MLLIHSIDIWEDAEKQRNFLKNVEIRLGIKELDDWYKIQQSEIIKLGGAGFLSQHSHSLVKALMAIYPGSLVTIVTT